MGTLLLCIPSGTPAANLLRTGVFERVRDHPSVGRIVIVSPYGEEPRFVEEFSHSKVGFADLDPGVPGWLERRFIRIMQEKFVKTMPTDSMRIRVARAGLLEREGQREVRYLDRGQFTGQLQGPKRLALKALTVPPLSIGAWFAIGDRFTLKHQYADLFARERPDLVVTPTSGLYFSEGPLLARADRERVPAIAVDLSWDHFTTKTAPLRRVAAMAVWNEQMKRQAVEIHGYRPEQVGVTGVPQFDVYRNPTALDSREAFLRRIGADPARALVALTTVPPVLYPHHARVIATLVEAIDRDALGPPAQLLVRVHPRDDLGQYAAYEGLPNVLVEKPIRTGRIAEGSNADPTLDDRRHLANTLTHADVVVNVASTIAVESAICDTPVVNIAFDGPEARPFLDSAARFYRYDHYRPLVEAGAVRVAASPEELLEQVRRYLAEPSLDREHRARVVEQLTFRADGRSAERVAEFILRELARLTGGTRQSVGALRAAPAAPALHPCAPPGLLAGRGRPPPRPCQARRRPDIHHPPPTTQHLIAMSTDVAVIDSRARFAPSALLHLVQFRELLVALTQREIKARYRQSLLGVGWAIAQPLALMFVFTLVFSRFARVGSEGLPYPIFSYAAMVPWTFLTNALNTATIGLVSQRSIVTKTYFPREIIVMSQVGARFVDFVAAMLVYALLMVVYQVWPTPWLLLLPVLVLLQLVLILALCMVTSALHVRFRDLAPVVQLGLQVWLYLTPVGYPIERVPEEWRLVYSLNPMVGIIEGYRAALAHGRAPQWDLLAISVAVSLVALVIAYVYFKRAERSFADII